MSDEILMDLDAPVPESAKHCPLIDRNCLKGQCAWWARDWHEEKNRYTLDCAVALIAIGVNDESLFRLKARRSSESI